MDCFEKAYAQISFTLIDARIRGKKGMLLFSNLEKTAAALFPGFESVCSSLSMGIKEGSIDQIHSSIRLVRQCIRIIHKNYKADISLSGAAKQLYISPNYLSKIFSAEMGKSFSRYLLEHRINISMKLLRETNDKVYEIACQVGYPDAVHFAKIFKQVTGQSPNRYRNQK